MKRFTCIAAATFAVLMPAFAVASPQVTLVYRPELRALVPVPSNEGTAAAPLSVSDQIARYEALARAARMQPNNRSGWTPAVEYEAAAQRLKTGRVSSNAEPGATAPTKKAASASQARIALSSPAALTVGDNQFRVTVKGVDGEPISDAAVSIQLDMARSATSGWIRKDVTLTGSGNGTYAGSGAVTTSGRWQATIKVSRSGRKIGQTKVVLVAA